MRPGSYLRKVVEQWQFDKVVGRGRIWRLSGVAYREVIAEDDPARAARAIAISLPERG